MLERTSPKQQEFILEVEDKRAVSFTTPSFGLIASQREISTCMANYAPEVHKKWRISGKMRRSRLKNLPHS